MNFSRLLTLGVASWALVACGGGVSLGTTSGALGSGDGDGDGSNGNPGAAGPYDITCNLYFEPAGRKLEDTFTVRSDGQKSKTITFPGYTIDASYAGSSEASAEATLSIAVGELGTTQQFQLARGLRPSQEFVGDHGFTGLVYVGSGLQYTCKASGSTPHAPSQTPSPIDVGCNVEVREGGAVKRTELIRFTGTDERTLDLGDFSVRAALHDSPYEGRGMFLTFWRTSASESDPTFKQLFQFDRNQPITNHLASHDFSGQVAIAKLPERQVSYAYSCAAR